MRRKRPLQVAFLILLVVVLLLTGVALLVLPGKQGSESGIIDDAGAAVRSTTLATSSTAQDTAASMCAQANGGNPCPQDKVNELAQALTNDRAKNTTSGFKPLARISAKRRQHCRTGWSRDYYNNLLGTHRLFDATVYQPFCYNGKKVTWVGKPLLRVRITDIGSVLWSEASRRMTSHWHDPMHSARTVQAEVVFRACKEIIKKVCLRDKQLAPRVTVHKSGRIWPPKPPV